MLILKIKFVLIIKLVQYLTQNVPQKIELLKVKCKEELKCTQTRHKICHYASVPQCTCCKLDMAWFSISAFIHLADLDLQLWEKILLLKSCCRCWFHESAWNLNLWYLLLLLFMHTFIFIEFETCTALIFNSYSSLSVWASLLWKPLLIVRMVNLQNIFACKTLEKSIGKKKWPSAKFQDF